MENKNKVGKPKGMPKTGGRKKGTPNAVTGNLRSKIEAVINDNWENVQEDLVSLDAKERLAFLEKLLSYAVPKLSATTAEIDVTNKLQTLNDEQLNALIDTILTQEDES